MRTAIAAFAVLITALGTAACSPPSAESDVGEDRGAASAAECTDKGADAAFARALKGARERRASATTICEAPGRRTKDIADDLAKAVTSCSRYEGILADDPVAEPIRNVLQGNIALSVLTGRVKVVETAKGLELQGLKEAVGDTGTVKLYGPTADAGHLLSDATLSGSGALLTTRSLDSQGKVQEITVQAEWRVEGSRIVFSRSGGKELTYKFEHLDPTGADKDTPAYRLAPEKDVDLPFFTLPDECE